MSKIIFRDDDAPVHGLPDFITVHELLRSYGLVHTVAVITRNLDRHHEFVKYVNSDPEFFDIQFHCHDHIDYSDKRNADILYSQFDEGLKMFYHCFGKMPDIWYPPWNKRSDYAESVAGQFNLRTSNVKFSFGQVLRKPEAIKQSGGVINFHHWCKEERDWLEEVIKLLTL